MRIDYAARVEIGTKETNDDRVLIDGQILDMTSKDGELTLPTIAVLLSMMDNISVKANANPKIIRDFFVKYGPVGIATYTKQLLVQNDNVYTPLDADGKQAISRITGFREPSSGTVDELFRAYTPLVESVDKLRRILIDNPFCVVTGVYENKGVMCTNLVGCFAFNIFERLAPLGFSYFIETAKGGTK